MEKIYLIKSESPTRLVRVWTDANKTNYVLKLDIEANDSYKEYVNIYVGSDKPINDGDWWLGKGRTYVAKDKIEWCHKNKYEKVIATTDPLLISDGVFELDSHSLENFISFQDSMNHSITSISSRFFDSKCKCINYLPGCFSANCRICGLAPNTDGLFGDAVCVKCGDVSCDNLSTKSRIFNQTSDEIKDRAREYGNSLVNKIYSEDEVEELLNKLMHEVHTGEIVYTDKVIDFKMSARQWFIQNKKK